MKKNIDVYSIDSDGFITEIKSVLEGYVMQINDIKGKSNFDIGYHHLTGVRKPKTQEQLNSERIEELKQIIPNKQLCGLDVTTEQEELKTLLGY